MNFDIPFYVQGKNECGQTSLKMVLAYFGQDMKIEDISRMAEKEKSGALWSIGLAKTAAELGYEVEFYSKSLGVNPENYNLEFYKRETDGKRESEKKSERLLKKLKEFNGKVEERSLTLEEIIGKMKEGFVPIVLLDWHVVLEKEGYQGHFVPILDCFNKRVIVHNASSEKGERYEISEEMFEKSRKALGTDEDIMFIRKK